MEFSVTPLTDIKTSTGIVIFSVSFSEPVTETAVLKVDVAKSRYTGAEICGIGSGKVIGVHTHLLDAGSHSIRFSLIVDGQVVGTTVETFSLEEGTGLYDVVRDALIAHGTPLLFEDTCDSSFYPYHAASLQAWFDRPDAESHIQGLLTLGQVSQEEADYLRDFVQKGFVVMEDMVDEDLVDAVNIEIDDAVAKGYQGYKPGTSQRLEHLHTTYPHMRKLWLDKRYRRIVDLIFGVQARPCQTLTYLFGSQQDIHQDLIHLTPFPAGYMCGTWIALQDVVSNSGELVVYPGSHRDRRVYLRDTGCAKVNGDWTEFKAKVVPIWTDIAARYEPLIYRPKKGTVLIWHENLLHAGSVRLDQSLERRSVVIHSFADGAVAYYDSTGAAGNVASHSTIGN